MFYEKAFFKISWGLHRSLSWSICLITKSQTWESFTSPWQPEPGAAWGLVQGLVWDQSTTQIQFLITATADEKTEVWLAAQGWWNGQECVGGTEVWSLQDRNRRSDQLWVQWYAGWSRWIAAYRKNWERDRQERNRPWVQWVRAFFEHFNGQ